MTTIEPMPFAAVPCHFLPSRLRDPSFIDIVPEPWWGGPTAVMTTIFPSVSLQQQVNSV